MMSHKKIHRFLVTSIPAKGVGGVLTIDEPRVTNQAFRVLKLKPGETVQFFSDKGPEYTVTIETISPIALAGTVSTIKEYVNPVRTVIAAISIVKGDAFEWTVQKITELGVTTIVPLISNRTVKQSVRLDRLQTISDEAVEQSGGMQRVSIVEPISLEECFAQYPQYSVVLDPITHTTSLSELPDTVVYYVGPEGGWDEKDEAVITAHDAHALNISDRVLRTETAAILGAFILLSK